MNSGRTRIGELGVIVGEVRPLSSYNAFYCAGPQCSNVGLLSDGDPASAVVLSGTTSADNLFLWIDVGPGADAQGVAFPPADVNAAGGLAPTNLPRTMIVRTNRVPSTESMPADLTPRGGSHSFDSISQVSGYQPHTLDLWYTIGIRGRDRWCAVRSSGSAHRFRRTASRSGVGTR